MMNEPDRMKKLKEQGFFCSQIIMILGLELQGKENPDLVRAMHGLAGGLGFTGETCGALTGGSSVLGVYAGRGNPK
ncbi:MAG: C-GCAxxG-C-C family protein, partial [Anaerolineae bacterium]|nr:C-GCAxxG-C-C family protein [Anaerolineae bacterium]